MTDWRAVPCNEWTGARHKFGHGQLTVRGRTVYAHRFAWEKRYGPIPVGLCVLHHCHNPPCIEPLHLFLGTRADNIADMMAKGRGRWLGQPGEANGAAKLSDVEVAEIRRRYAAGGVTQRSLAAEFGVCRPNISMIVNYRTRRR